MGEGVMNITLYIAGLMVGFASSTLYWQGPLEESRAQTARALELSEQNHGTAIRCLELNEAKE